MNYLKREELPEKLKKVEPIIEKLYYKGERKNLEMLSIAIIGSRSCSERGIRIANNISKDLAKAGFCIVSGMAKGIDTAAHRGALEAGGKTIAVMGGGFNHIFPPENVSLYRDILEMKGTVITEYKDDIQPNKNTFPMRNRIVSGLSDGILVIEAGYRSGTSITVRIAKEQGKTIFCIPNNIDSRFGIGTNNMIKSGAQLVTSSEDIISFYKDKLPKNIKKERIVKESYKQIYELLKEEPLNINSLVQKSGKPITEINEKLFLMELDGLILKLPGDEYKIVE